MGFKMMEGIGKMKTDLSIDLYLWGDYKLHRGHIIFLGYYYTGDPEFLPAKHKFITELEKGGFIYENEITPKGKALWEEIEDWDGVYAPTEKVKKKKVEYSPEFIEWWELFPSTDNFEYAGVGFNGTRTLKIKKDECYTKYQNILSEGKYSHRELMVALEWEKIARMDQSVIRNKNEFTFSSGTLVYLNQRKFEAYVPLAKKGPYQPKSVSQNKIVITTNSF